MKKELIYIVVTEPKTDINLEEEDLDSVYFKSHCLARIHAEKIEEGIYLHLSNHLVETTDEEGNGFWYLEVCKSYVISDQRTGLWMVTGKTKKEVKEKFEAKRQAYEHLKKTELYKQYQEDFKTLAKKRVLEVKE